MLTSCTVMSMSAAVTALKRSELELRRILTTCRRQPAPSGSKSALRLRKRMSDARTASARASRQISPPFHRPTDRPTSPSPHKIITHHGGRHLRYRKHAPGRSATTLPARNNISRDSIVVVVIGAASPLESSSSSIFLRQRWRFQVSLVVAPHYHYYRRLRVGKSSSSSASSTASSSF